MTADNPRPPDDINDLMVRCESARLDCEELHGRTLEEFKIIHFSDGESQPWLVGFYEPGQGKQTSAGTTLVDTLTSWLADYEHQWRR